MKNILLLIMMLVSLDGYTCLPFQKDVTIKDEWSIIKNYNKSEIIVIGKVIKIKNNVAFELAQYNTLYEYATIEILEEIKGNVPELIVARTSNPKYLCHYHRLVRGQKYLFSFKSVDYGYYEYTDIIKPIDEITLDREIFEKIANGELKPDNERFHYYLKPDTYPRYKDLILDKIKPYNYVNSIE